ncbi:NADH-quinone oxidoreductase subunit G [Sneathiella sp. P13V-1]|uniref:NADH-quinone oxidoreductase subunit NuoG n=1 Tax=Sneathiella sp. P13V-1 TaxID=2697366 RepID=UPI00187B5600|nr:NADH-quinone oxidoreductase subunit NuoG [Sneathiella sp. P13V-1]MBE7637597.1 NADH-quinone oxidoreductase subunit G [Sneathiella sp. P13V-1]
MPTLTVDGVEVTVEDGATILQACEEAGAEIPRFCYHERLSIAGNCRMCLVEMEKAPKLVASCAMPAGDGMVIHTNTEKVKNGREGAMEFLLINHPLDCPICDQGGECDLQDQSMTYGSGNSRYLESKRAVKEKFMGPLIKTTMTRCIHCTRCVRFATEVAGVDELGALNRGEHTEIVTYLEEALNSELSGNIIDLCPVGALTSKPYAFTARPWELRKTESVDALDAVGANIRIDSKGQEVMRILPRLNEDINEEWLSDRSRFSYDGLKRQRLDTPYVRKDGKLQAVGWDEALQVVADKLNATEASKIAAISGDVVCAESMKALKDLMDAYEVANIDCRQDGAKLDASSRAAYIFNSGIAGIDEADALLIIGSNPRQEASLINARIRKRWKKGNFPIALIGEEADLTYKHEYVGAGTKSLQEVAEGKHSFADVLKKAERPMIIIGQGALSREDGAAVLALAKKMADDFGVVNDGWNGFNVLHTAASRVAGLDLGLVPGEGGKDVAGILAAAEAGDVDVVYLLGADELDTSKLEKSFVIYQGSHGDAGAHVADVILPGVAYTEKDGIWVNTEGRPQLGNRAVFGPGDAREDWTILRALSEVAGKTLPYNNIDELRAKMVEVAPHLADVDMLTSAEWGAFGTAGDLSDAPFKNPIADNYLTNAISRASGIMAECSQQFVSGAVEGTGTNG